MFIFTWKRLSSFVIRALPVSSQFGSERSNFSSGGTGQRSYIGSGHNISIFRGEQEVKHARGREWDAGNGVLRHITISWQTFPARRAGSAYGGLIVEG